MCAQVFSTLSRTSGCRWAWMETFISLTRWRRTAGETTAALLPSLEYEPLFRRRPCLSLSRQVGVTQGCLKIALHLSAIFLSKQHDAIFELSSEDWSFPTCSLMSIFIAALQKPSKCHLSCLCTSPWFYVVNLILVMFVMMFPRCPRVHCDFFLCVCVSHPPPFQKKQTWVLKLVS